MSQQAPPPLPNGGPPPPLPSGLPPPMPVGGLPPPPMGGLPPPPMGHMQMHGGPRGRNNTPFTNVVLITHLPPFVGGYQQVKDWLYPCGTTKSCFFYPKDKNVKKTVLIHMAFPDQAVKVVASFQKFASKLDERYQEMKCFMVPSSPDVPLPPVLLDETSQEVLGEKLWNNFVGLETTQEAPESTQEAPSQKEPKLLDADKVAAAAGGALGYDADEDPLNAPQVLEAVKAFRRKLDKTQGSQKTQRMELVAKKLQELRPKIRAQVDAEKALPVPPPSLSLPPPPPTMDSGKRGRSNLPAWMTQQQQQQPSKKAKAHPSNFPSSLPSSSHTILKEFLAQQVKESMGEEEATLIDFLYRHILEGKSTADLLQELKVVLEEEADAFLDAVWTKVQALENS